MPDTEFDWQLVSPLIELRAVGAELGTMNTAEMQDFAWRIWQVFQDVAEACETRVDEEYARDG